MRRVFSFTSTTKDLLDAHNAHLTITGGVRPWLRPVLIGLGLLWLGGSLLLLIMSLREGFSFDLPSLVRIPVGLFAGSVITWRYWIRPMAIKRQIKCLPSKQPVVITFYDSRIKVATPGADDVVHKMNDIDWVKPVKKGLLVAFTDGRINWLPIRIFSGVAEMHELAEFIHQRLPKTDHPDD